MPRNCSICASERLADINRAIIQEGASIRDAAFRYNVSPSAVGRHLTKCLQINRRGKGRSKAQKLGGGSGKVKPKGVLPRIVSDDGRCGACGQLVGESEDQKLDAKALLRRAERALYFGEGIVMKAVENEDDRLALQGLDRVKVLLDQLMRVHGMVGPDTVVNVDRRSLNLFEGLSEEQLRALKADIQSSAVVALDKQKALNAA